MGLRGARCGAWRVGCVREVDTGVRRRRAGVARGACGVPRRRLGLRCVRYVHQVDTGVRLTAPRKGCTAAPGNRPVNPGSA